MEKDGSSETPLDKHKRNGKILTPPLAQIQFTPNSWIHNRLPEMLIGILAIDNLNRDDALNFFRHIGDFVKKNPEAEDITITGLSKLTDEKLKDFISNLLGYSEEISTLLKPLLLYDTLPKKEIWKEMIGDSEEEEDWDKIGNSIFTVVNHQSQEATDCRWLRLLCMVNSGKLKMSEKHTEPFLKYPNKGDMHSIRPMIRATEIAIPFESSNWSNDFWKESFEKTPCRNGTIFNTEQEDFEKEALEIEKRIPELIENMKEMGGKLTTHFFHELENTTIDTRRETCFGLALYGFSLFSEGLMGNNYNLITGRLILRSLVETLLTFQYLLSKETEKPQIWNDFHEYGTGKIKQIYLKIKDMKNTSSMNLHELGLIVNEDQWIEFVHINLGHWNGGNLRKISEEAGLKEIYDKFYDYTSGFTHGTRGAIRESNFDLCLNPLHRFHRIPSGRIKIMPSTFVNSKEILNKIFECLDKAYPDFKDRVK